jgi:hypothetical protein
MQLNDKVSPPFLFFPLKPLEIESCAMLLFQNMPQDA